MTDSTSQKPRKPPRYDSVATQYDGVMRPLERWLFARLRVKVFAALPEDGSLLEVGSGTGANFALYPKRMCTTASELSFKMIEQSRVKTNGKRVSIVQNCAEQLPFPDDSFDAAVVTLVFCSVISQQESFAELRRVVRTGGTISMLEHVRPSGLLGFIFDALSLVTVAIFDDHINRRTADNARRSGLDITTVERHALGIVNVIVCKV